MFLQACVILFTGDAWSRGSGPSGVPGTVGVPGGDPPRTATAAGGMHPTGMHSCFYRRILTERRR